MEEAEILRLEAKKDQVKEIVLLYPVVDHEKRMEIKRILIIKHLIFLSFYIYIFINVV